MAVIARKQCVTDGRTDGQTEFNNPPFFSSKKQGIITDEHNCKLFIYLKSVFNNPFQGI